MRTVVLALLALVALTRPLAAQESEQSAQGPSMLVRGVSPPGSTTFTFQEPPPRKLGVLTLVPPVSRGEVVRVRLPIGELVSRAAQGVAASHRRGREAAARREVRKDLEAFLARQRAASTGLPAGTAGIETDATR